MNIQGSIYRRLMLQLVGSAAILAAILFLLFQSFARQLAVESQDTTLQASASAILESVSVQQGQIQLAKSEVWKYQLPVSSEFTIGKSIPTSEFYRSILTTRCK